MDILPTVKVVFGIGMTIQTVFSIFKSEPGIHINLKETANAVYNK